MNKVKVEKLVGKIEVYVVCWTDAYLKHGVVRAFQDKLDAMTYVDEVQDFSDKSLTIETAPMDIKC